MLFQALWPHTNVFVVALVSLVCKQSYSCESQSMTDSERKGQAYAFRQAGLTMGVILLVALTVTVCVFQIRVQEDSGADPKK